MLLAGMLMTDLSGSQRAEIQTESCQFYPAFCRFVLDFAGWIETEQRISGRQEGKETLENKQSINQVGRLSVQNIQGHSDTVCISGASQQSDTDSFDDHVGFEVDMGTIFRFHTLLSLSWFRGRIADCVVMACTGCKMLTIHERERRSSRVSCKFELLSPLTFRLREKGSGS